MNYTYPAITWDVIRLTDPATEPVTLTQVKLNRAIDISDDDDDLEIMISTARESVENYCNRYFCDASAALLASRMPRDRETVHLPMPDIRSITEVTYRDLDTDVEYTISSSDYIFSSERQTIRPVAAYSWPDGYDFRVQCVAGKGTADSPTKTIPKPVVSAIFLAIGDLYEHREAQTISAELRENKAFVNLLQPYRVSMGI